jgi:hypothetical protein
LAQDDEGRAYLFADHLVVERRMGGKRIEARLPAGDMDWLWDWSQLLASACDALAAQQLMGS